MDDFGFRTDENGLPLIEDCVKHNFADYHYIAGFSASYRNFYQNKANIQDKFVEFWKTVVTRFKGNKYVLGYDLWNEPAPGGVMEDIKNMIPGRPDIKDILPVYRKVDTELRKIDPNYILFFENTPVPDTLPIFGGIFLGSMSEKPAGDEMPQVYNFHTYCCLSSADICSHGEANYDNSLKVCPTYHEKQFKKEIKTAANLNVPMFLSEFGACSDSKACYNEIVSVVKICEENFISWSYWNRWIEKPNGFVYNIFVKNVKENGGRSCGAQQTFFSVISSMACSGRSRAARGCEPCQAGNRAALSGMSRVPRPTGLRCRGADHGEKPRREGVAARFI